MCVSPQLYLLEHFKTTASNESFRRSSHWKSPRVFNPEPASAENLNMKSGARTAATWWTNQPTTGPHQQEPQVEAHFHWSCKKLLNKRPNGWTPRPQSQNTSKAPKGWSSSLPVKVNQVKPEAQHELPLWPPCWWSPTDRNGRGRDITSSRKQSLKLFFFIWTLFNPGQTSLISSTWSCTGRNTRRFRLEQKGRPGTIRCRSWFTAGNICNTSVRPFVAH